MPPDFLFRAVEFTQNNGLIKTGTPPFKTQLIKFVRAVRTFCFNPGSLSLIKSFKTWGRKPEGLPAEPAGKDKMARRVSSSDVEAPKASPVTGNIALWS